SKRIYTASWDNTIKIWEVKTGKLQQSLDSHEAPLESMDMDREGRDLISASEDNTIKKWSAVSGSLQYSFFPVDRDDYLLMDGRGRYDGTEGARRMLYFACGPRLEDLEQFKNLMWEPSLAKKCNGLDEEPITASRLSDIKVCNYSPLVEQSMRGDSVFEFKITPGAGGVGRLDLCVNRKQVASFEPQNLQKENGSFWLSVDRRAVQDYFLPGEENTVYLKISTLDGQTLTRGNPIASTAAPRPATSANVYLVIAGVSKYKGKDLRLNYAAKDAADFSAVITAAARKLFDIDGTEHVHPYLFLTDSLARQPLKRNIASVVDTISRLARAQDILLVFFAGHGLMEPNKKTYYVLTSDAADFNISGIEDQVAVSTDELNQWSSRIKANKQVLILDACSSGQVISNLSTLFNRGDVPADQQRALEELKDKTGLYILCASASGQAARESGLYNQGLLTYALLSGIKFGEAMKNDKFIDVSMWFNFASQEVRKLAREAGSDQQPQILGSASFDIGIADNDIVSRINLFSKKKIFLRSRFVDDEVLLTDGLNFTGVVDRELNNLSEKGRESPLVFVPDNGADSAFSLHGKYQVFGDSVRIKVYLIMGQKKLLYSFEQRGLVNDRDELAAALVSRIRKYIVNFTFKE
ncbi:MAG TPA: caspase family protein, partial [Puia sp.]|nr:caspase family protein [Puia sp.]